MKEYINEALREYNKKGKYPWHMPGHKRQDCFCENIWQELFAIDYTEAKDLDDMHSPKTFIKDSLDAVGLLYGSYRTYMLVNGSTAGILAAIHACTRRGEDILVARNCHKSVYNAIELQGLKPEYIMPEYIEDTDIFGDIKPCEVDECLERMKRENRLPAAVVITSPTYEGVISDISGIADIVHSYDVLLIVDEAQGAHFSYINKASYKTAMEAGADIVIESLHKTMPALTQTSLLHVMNSKLTERVEKYLHIFQTSSPSYVFMQSMEKAIRYGDSHRKEFLAYIDYIIEYRKRYQKFKNINILRSDVNVYAYDFGKLVFMIRSDTYIETDGERKLLTGRMLGDILERRYHQVVEMTSVNYIIAMTSIADKQEAYEKLYQALKEIDENSYRVCTEEQMICDYSKTRRQLSIPKRVCLPCEVPDKDTAYIPLAHSEGRISAGYVYAYPPGIPVIVPGEKIDRTIMNNIKCMYENNLNIEGIKTNEEDMVRLHVCRNFGMR